MTGRLRARLTWSVLVAIARRSWRVALFATDALGVLRAIGTRHPSTERRRYWINHMRAQLIVSWMDRGGVKPVRALVRPSDAIAHLRPPMIIGTFHIGPTLSLGVLRERLNGDTVILRGPMGTTDQQRAAAFHRTLESLRANAFVVIALDPREAQRIAVPFRGRTLQLARGPFAMARIARVPIVPVVARWDGDEIELVVGDPLPASEDEHALAASAGRWLDEYLRENPGELSYRILELMG